MTQQQKNFIFFLFLVIFLLLSHYNKAYSLPIQWDLDYEYTEAYHPDGEGPWITVTIEKSPLKYRNNFLYLVIQTHLKRYEFLKEIYFNFADSYLPPRFIDQSSTAPYPSITFRPDSLHAAGGGYFDLKLKYDYSSAIFNTDKISIIQIMDSFLTPESFNLTSVNGPTQLYCAAHVGGIGSNADYSGWLTTTTPIPEPSTFILLLFACMNFFACKILHRRIK